jgi:hypothetical protein
VTSQIVEITVGQTGTLLSAGGISLTATCEASPQRAVVRLGATGNAAYSSDSTSLGKLNGDTGGPGASVAIASWDASQVWDGGRFNLISYAGASAGNTIGGTFMGYLAAGACLFEASALKDSGLRINPALSALSPGLTSRSSGASASNLTARNARMIAPIARTVTHGRKGH